MRNQWKQLWQWTVFSILLISPPALAIQLENIYVSDRVTLPQVVRLRDDFDALRRLSFGSTDPEYTQVFEHTLVNPPALIDWLNQRVHYLLEDQFNQNRAIDLGKSLIYPNQEWLPAIQAPSLIEDETVAPKSASAIVIGSPVETVITNLGLSAYYQGKIAGRSVRFNIPGVGKIKVDSPRVGVLKLSKTFFNSVFSDEETFSGSALAIANRLQFLFHEARHGDGNGRSLGFLHEICPTGPYRGASACDRNLNGPYLVAARFLKLYASGCTDCTPGDIAGIHVLEADQWSRVLIETEIKSEKEINQRVNELQRKLDLCITMVQLKVQVTEKMHCDLKLLREEIEKEAAVSRDPRNRVQSTLWNANPESIPSP